MWALIIGLVGALLYAPTLRFGFIGYDDTLLITQNQEFLSRLSNIGRAFLQGAWRVPGFDGGNIYYRPVYTLSFMFDSQFDGSNPLAFHLSNVVQHGIVSGLVFALLLAMGNTRPVAAVGALFFAVHPTFVHVVAWVPGRADSLLAIFALTSVLALALLQRSAQVSDARKRVLLLAHWILFALALFTKESAIVLPLLGGVLLLHRPTSVDRRIVVAGWIPTIVLWAVLRSVSVDTPNDFPTLVTNVLRHAIVPVHYLGKAVVPLGLSVTPTIADTSSVFGIVVLVGLTLCAFLSKSRRPFLIGFGVLWFLAFILPSLSVPRKAALEQRMYLPMVGFLLLVLGFVQVPKARSVRWGVATVLAIYLGLLATITIGRFDAYSSRIAFWENAVATAPHASYARASLGAVYVARSRYQEAEEQYQAAVGLNPLEPKANHNLGFLAAQREDYESAARYFEREIQINPGFADAYFNLGQVLSTLGRPEEALSLWVRTLEIAPGHEPALASAVQYYVSVGKRQEAEDLIARYGDRARKRP